MARSVVLRGVPRCPHCQIAPRWCVCAESRAVALPFALDVLMHNSEVWKPTSTGNLIRRVVPASRRIVWHNQCLPRREDVVRDGGADALWILHPRGEALEDVLRDQREQPPPGAGALENLRVLLIDGTWAQANDMLRHVDGWGRKVRLPVSALRGESRYWLRAQHSAGHFSTIEALIALLNALGFASESDTIRGQFEMHVYAMLLARGHKTRAGQFLAGSPIGASMPELVRQLQAGSGRAGAIAK
ncbi:tRNA-uridine aminocarboxypropyltransferase [Ereboglobus luteus]|uniref:tRNA-uridine aminocarboxypropyltransferase n=1 Tax=Ereboglobus luteus TaxID=1796921 RepID=A0A2U8DZH3_9BACT|nr:tRNA-uridine aminocarboxypropyltransferase [Ereboglobus luteus]AWI08009.1 DTW domain-containing protein [Ereboglobus luteus]